MTKISKIIFLQRYHFNKWHYNRIDIDSLEKEGFAMEIWDIASILAPQKELVADTMPDDKVKKILRIFGDKRSVIKALSTLGPEVFLILNMRYSINTYFLYRAISKYKIKYALDNIKWGQAEDRPKLKARLPLILSPVLFGFLFRKIPFWWLGIKAADVLLTAALCFKSNIKPITEETQILHHHNYNYETYLSKKDNPVQYDDKLVVFVDRYIDLPQASSYIYSKSHCSSLNKFFTYLSAYGYRVVISAHPNSSKRLAKCFANNEVVVGKTDEMIRKCNFALTHISTAVDFAVLYNKPVIFLTTNVFVKTNVQFYITKIAKGLGKVPWNIDNLCNFALEKELIIDEIAYAKYKHEYIKYPGTSDIPYWQNFANNLKELYP